MSRGGRRLGAGRKSDADIARVRDIMSKFITEDDWGAMFKAMQAQARKGNVRAFIALMDRQFGPPTQSIAGPDGGPLIKTIEIRLPPGE